MPLRGAKRPRYAITAILISLPAPGGKDISQRSTAIASLSFILAVEGSHSSHV